MLAIEWIIDVGVLHYICWLILLFGKIELYAKPNLRIFLKILMILYA